MERILYTSQDVRKAIIHLFSSSKGRRVAITAFVGDGAEAYLPKPMGLNLICWPKAGGTNPNTLRILKKGRVKISFADSVHMKVYWTEDQGAVLTSANLSTNALGSGNLKEVGIFLSPGELDIDRLISSIKTRPMRHSELLKLDRKHTIYVIRNRIKTRSKAESFGEWYNLPYRQEWKLYCWIERGGAISLKAKEISKNIHGVSEPKSVLYACKGEYIIRDCILSFALKMNSPSQLEWVFADHIVRVSRSDKKAYDTNFPYQVVQVWPNKTYPAPFRIDNRFKDAFVKAVRKYGASRIEKPKLTKPPKRLIDLIYKLYISK
jgi:hypothetical protein